VTRSNPRASQPGDHWIVVGQADHLRVSPNDDPLLFYASEFGTLR
jgi:flavin reductase (DIM6/NTAB) family NADH-FMN oxidoreductase RutF